MFYSTAHWHPLLNGYSGHFPLSYNLNATHLRHPLDYPDASWETLMRSGATHAVVHGPYYRDDEGERIGQWLVEQRCASWSPNSMVIGCLRCDRQSKVGPEQCAA